MQSLSISAFFGYRLVWKDGCSHSDIRWRSCTYNAPIVTKAEWASTFGAQHNAPFVLLSIFVVLYKYWEISRPSWRKFKKQQKDAITVTNTVIYRYSKNLITFQSLGYFNILWKNARMVQIWGKELKQKFKIQNEREKKCPKIVRIVDHFMQVTVEAITFCKRSVCLNFDKIVLQIIMISKMTLKWQVNVTEYDVVTTLSRAHF